MRRRELLAAAMLAVWPLSRASATKTPRVGFVYAGARGAGPQLSGLRQGLADHGYVEGRDLVIDERYAEGQPEKITALIADLLSLGVDVLVTVGASASLQAHKATTIVPIVCVTGDPVGVGLAASLARPGGNVTGISLLAGDYSAKWLGLLKAAAPNVQRVAVLWNPDNPIGQREMQRIDEAARRLDASLTRLSILPPDREASLTTLGSGRFDGLLAPDEPLGEPLLPQVITLAQRLRLPALYGFDDAVRMGGLMSYSANFYAIWRRAAGYVDRILKGASASDLPIEQATEIALRLNLKAAKALGLEFPQALLAAADEVIE